MCGGCEQQGRPLLVRPCMCSVRFHLFHHEIRLYKYFRGAPSLSCASPDGTKRQTPLRSLLLVLTPQSEREGHPEEPVVLIGVSLPPFPRGENNLEKMAPISGATAVLVMAVVATLAAAANALAPAPAPATSDGQLSGDPLFFPLLLHVYFLSRLLGGG